MYAIIGAAGKVGYATASALRQAGKPVRAILRSEKKAALLRDIGCEVALADIEDVQAMIQAIGEAACVQVIIPPAPQAEDTAKEMRNDIESLAAALEQVKPKRILAISDYGAHVTQDIGMPTMCRSLEQRISQLGGHKIILRSAEHMQNWARAIPAAAESGILRTFHDPVDVEHPTISASDVGLISAELLLRFDGELKDAIEIFHAEGPRRYSTTNVAATLSEILGQSIRTEIVPRSQWQQAFERVMSPSLAELLIKANDAQNTGGLVDVEPGSQEVLYGSTELIDALRALR